MTPPTRDAPIRLLDPAGNWAPGPDAEPFLQAVEELSDDTLLHFYREMVLTRRLDEASTALQRQGQLALWIPSFGQEAAQTGPGHALAPQDTVFPSYREYGVALARGIDFVGILGAQTLHAVGYAMGISLDRYRDVETAREAVIVYLGDGAMSEGDSSEALVFAHSFDSPVVFFVQNNGWAISTPTTVPTTVPYARRVDGNDVLAIYAVTKTIMDKTRAGAGRALIEAVTYRRGPHTSSDDPTKYRSKNEEEHWAQLDPIARFAAHLQHLDIDDDFFAESEEATSDLVADVRRRLIALPAPESAIMFDHVYTDPQPRHPTAARLAQQLPHYQQRRLAMTIATTARPHPNPRPRISIVIPARNEAAYLRECLDAIARQTLSPDEVIVVDNASTDSTAQIAGSYDFVTLLYESTLGIIPARNRGLDAADGDVLCRIDADTILDPEWVHTVSEHFRSVPKEAVRGATGPGDALLPRTPRLGKALGYTNLNLGYFLISRLLTGGQVLVGCNMAITRTAWQAIRPDSYLDDRALHEDLDLSVLIHREGGTIDYLPEMHMATRRVGLESPAKIWWRLRVWPVATARHWPALRHRWSETAANAASLM